MTDPATYIEGRTVQEQMNSLIGYVDQRSAEVALDAIAADVAQVAADKADAHADALAAAASAAAAAGTLANAVKKTGEASQSIQGDISIVGALSAGATSLLGNSSVAGDLTIVNDLSVSGDATLSGDTTVTTEATGTFTNKAANSLKVKNELDAYAPMVRTTGNQTIDGIKSMVSRLDFNSQNIDLENPPSYSPRGLTEVHAGSDLSQIALREELAYATGGNTFNIIVHGRDTSNNDITATLQITIFRDGDARLQLVRPNGTVVIVPKG